MLTVAAGENGPPDPLFILVKSDDLLFHLFWEDGSRKDAKGAKFFLHIRSEPVPSLARGPAFVFFASLRELLIPLPLVWIIGRGRGVDFGTGVEATAEDEIKGTPAEQEKPAQADGDRHEDDDDRRLPL